MKNKQYFQLVTAGNTADLTIYGEITSWPVLESDVSSHNLSAQLAALQNVSKINVYINSYGGEVAEGVAIYNALKRHPAQVTTYCDGFACSIASVIFMAGDERVMCNPSRLMIHDAWTVCSGNADELRKAADDMDNINEMAVTAYMQYVSISEDELRAKMKAESWLTEEEALEMGFATAIDESTEAESPSQNAKKSLFEMLKQVIVPKNAEVNEEEPEKPVDASDNEDESDDEEGNLEPQNELDNDPDPAQKWSGFFNAISRV